VPAETTPNVPHGSSFDVAVRVARLGLESSGGGVETMERYVVRVARAYDIPVETAVLPESAEPLLPFTGGVSHHADRRDVALGLSFVPSVTGTLLLQ
jgi:hypothetical protein